MVMKTLPLLVLAGLFSVAAPVVGARDGGEDDAGAVARGRAIVVRDCSGCHAISGPGPSSVADAPAFSRLSRRYPVEFLAEALAEGIMVNHPTVGMPVFRYAPEDIDAILAYLESVQEER